MSFLIKLLSDFHFFLKKCFLPNLNPISYLIWIAMKQVREEKYWLCKNIEFQCFQLQSAATFFPKHGTLDAWSYISHLKTKIKRPVFRKLIVMNFFLILAIEFQKKK